MKASLKGRYANEKNTAGATLVVNAGDVKLRASMSDATFVDGPSLNGLTLAVEKPVRVAEMPLKLTYSHGGGDNRTAVEGAFMFDSANTVSANYVFGTRNCKLKYSYVHGGDTTFEQCYDWGKMAWDFAISRRVYDDVFKATYQTSNSDLALEWSRNSKFNGTFKIRELRRVSQ
ncbi:outer envelope pore protein 24A, chloroplastic-like [Gossypium australe]|uniref:Outer envelope pore protein 24A, chloroplastic-like n=1 Tax=Gossypium australe TaxID=47621 RepID=A0A5B6W434_9ROSI|nr:outer envelope pore protein 24A, chloroplastic-like [Gossypium australe]